jgi:ferric-dicitrate binding protein FerR (iron transport regulator)
MLKYTTYPVCLLVMAGIHIQCGERRADPVSSLQNSRQSYTTYEGQVGQRKKFRLADSSIVILNAGSRLLVPANFPQGGRELILDGEGFFDASHHPAGQPFIVKTDKLTITALGTAFKIRSFAAQPGATAYLLNGKVKVAKTYHSTTDNQPEILERGQMVLANKEIDLMEKETYDPAELEAWLQGELRFRDVPFMTVMRQLEDWYAVTITINGDVSAAQHITANFHNSTLQQVLDALHQQVKYRYKIKEGEVELTINN